MLAILEMRSTSLCVEPDASVPGVTRIARDPAWPRPWVLVVGSIHGDEPCGREALARLIEDAREGALALSRGTVIALHGNPVASTAGARSSPGGPDLNRLFDFRFEDELTRHHWRHEHHRALTLRPLVDAVDVAIDIHSARAPTPPFAICMSSAGSLDIAMRLGVAYVTVGWNGPGLLGHQVVLAALARRDRPAVAVECGSHDDPASCDVAASVVRRFLVATGVVSPARSEPPFAATVLRIRDAIKRPGPGFRFARSLVGLERLGPGDLVGSDANVEVRMRTECFAVMPNDDVAVGEDMLYLAGPE